MRTFVTSFLVAFIPIFVAIDAIGVVPVVSLGATMYSTAGWSRAGIYFYPLFQVQLIDISHQSGTGIKFYKKCCVRCINDRFWKFDKAGIEIISVKIDALIESDETRE